jgi:hypothetical protein
MQYQPPGRPISETRRAIMTEQDGWQLPIRSGKLVRILAPLAPPLLQSMTSPRLPP